MPTASDNASGPGLLGGTRLIGGVLLLVVLGANLGTDPSGRLAPGVRGHAARELATTRTLGERVAWAFWALVGRPDAARAEATGFGPAGSPGELAKVVARVGSSPAKGIEAGVWLLDLPPPAVA